jgi:hypothetical protein
MGLFRVSIRWDIWVWDFELCIICGQYITDNGVDAAVRCHEVVSMRRTLLDATPVHGEAQKLDIGMGVDTIVAAYGCRGRIS